MSDDEAFHRLLAWLDPDRERAALIYEDLRRRLIRFFEWRGCEFSEDLADEALIRLARRVAAEVEIQDPYKYCRGVAHNIYKEVLRERAQQERFRNSGDWPPKPAEPEEEDRRLLCVRRCLDRLPRKDHELIVDYYEGDDRIRRRQQLADRLGVQLNALRIRVHRIRRRVEDCLASCLEEP